MWQLVNVGRRALRSSAPAVTRSGAAKCPMPNDNCLAKRHYRIDELSNFLIALYCFDRLDDLWKHLKGIAYNTVVGRLKEWCFGILVDDHNTFAAVNAGEVLDGPGDADGDV